MHRHFSRLLPLAALAVLPAAFAGAQVVLAPTTPEAGSLNPVTAEPLVPRPTTKPRTVALPRDEKTASTEAETIVRIRTVSAKDERMCSSLAARSHRVSVR